MPPSPPDPADTLDPVERLALAYADKSARPAWEALLLLQHRLADTARPGREPLMIQIRLAWWRDRLTEPAAKWPKGEPLLSRLHVWEQEAAALIGLVDGWEAAVVGEDGGEALATARIAAFEALARLVNAADGEAVRLVARQMIDPVLPVASVPRLSRKMRPLSVLRAFAVREQSGGASRSLTDFAVLMRVGLLGR